MFPVVTQFSPTCLTFQNPISHGFIAILQIHQSLGLSTECFKSLKQNSVHFDFNPCMQHDVPCCDGVRSYYTSFCSGHQSFGVGESSPLLFSQSITLKSCSAYYAGPQQKIHHSVPIRKQNCPKGLKKMPGLLGLADWGWISTGCTITQEVHRRLPTAQARFRPQNSLLWNFYRQLN